MKKNNAFTNNIKKENVSELEKEAIKHESNYNFLRAAALYLQIGEFYLESDSDKSANYFFKSNRCIEKTEYPRIVPSLWEVVGNLLSKSKNATLKFSTHKYKEQNQLFHVIPDDTWKNIHGLYGTDEKSKHTHRQSWSFMWAAERFDYYGDYLRALPLYRKAALAWAHCKWPKKSEFNKWYLVGRSYAGACYCNACISGNLAGNYKVDELNSETEQGEYRDDYLEMKHAFEKGYQSDGGREKISKYRHNVMIKLEGKLKEFGNISAADNVYTDRMDCRRKEYWKNTKFLRWLSLFLWKILTKYGTSPIRFALFLILTFGLIFPFLFQKFEVVESTGLSPTIAKDFITCLYFSIITATTLGYGDYHPVGIGIYISTFEVMLGLVFFGLLLQMFIRRIR